MTVTAPTGVTASSAATTSSTGSAGVGSDYQTFLTMLTTQLENQDPLNPMEASDFAVQLATFSGVEQQVKTNELLGAILNGGALSGIGQYAGWIGMEAQVPAAAWFDGAALTLNPTPAEGADSAKLVVTDSKGETVSSTTIDVAAGPVAWEGVGSDGEALPPGQYTFTLQSYSAGNLLSTAPVPVYAQVVETRLAADGTAMLILEGGAEVAASQATALRKVD